MTPSKFQQSSEMVLALLRNARSQAVLRQDRLTAMDVLRACSLYVRGTRFPCDPDVFDRLAASIVDKQNPAIMEEFARVEKSLTDAMASAGSGPRREPFPLR